ncbi:GNAT family N-acetyltransferase [Alteromonas gilva]|uniref:GNAT family N-acetyltransferase n=1 Tax=Alteromonas gilva TaxID=2987522 RepID=A0ABT5L236_9ALTE|nr:GNAT family N-acetyltransferase [Alteromonas gilva]MDC8830938.1 GNAT family N-acetyltransferase [Alteromonas gilva]
MQHIHCYCPQSWDKALFDRVAVLMQQLRPQYPTETLSALLAQQVDDGYKMVLAQNAQHQIVGIAGYVLGHKLAWGHYLYIDDLVVDEHHRGQRVGQALLDFCQSLATQHHCDSLHLDSGSQRHRAHKFYLGQGMHISSFHFTQAVNQP